MDLKSLSSNFSLLQTFLAGAGFFAPDKQTSDFFKHLKSYALVIGISAAVGIVFLLTGLYLYLIEIMPPYKVCMIMGGVIFALAVVILGTRIFVFFIVKRKIQKSMREVYKDAKEVLADVTDDLKEPIKQNPETGIIVAMIGGFLLARKFFSRH